jgi:hypothetical protein
MSYRLIFDVCAAGYRNWWIPGEAIAVAIIACALAVAWLLRPWKRRYLPGLVWLALVALVSGFTGVSSFRATHGRYASMCGALREGRFTTVEGPVSGFAPYDTAAQHAIEKFDVGDHHFSYNPRSHATGFHEASHGGAPIGDGLQVRIAVVEGEIARLETADVK